MTAPGPLGDETLGEEPVGTVVEEAVKLFSAFTASAAQHSSDQDSSAPGPAEHSCSTAWCPVCQVVDIVREHPEAVASVARSATSLVRSLRDLVETVRTPQEEQ